MGHQPDVRFARVTSVSDVVRDAHGRVSALYQEVVPDQARSRGFCASYWLADPSSGAGLAISLWEGAAQLSASTFEGRRRRERFEQLLGCHVDSVREFEALGVATEPTGPLTPEVPVAQRRHRRSIRRNGTTASRFSARELGDALNRAAVRGTALERPPGSLLAIEDEPAREVIVLLDGRATAVNADDTLHLLPGANVGACGVTTRRPNTHTVVATSPVDLLVLSRSEFALMAIDLPAVTDYLIEADVER